MLLCEPVRTGSGSVWLLHQPKHITVGASPGQSHPQAWLSHSPVDITALAQATPSPNSKAHWQVLHLGWGDPTKLLPCLSPGQFLHVLVGAITQSSPDCLPPALALVYASRSSSPAQPNTVQPQTQLSLAGAVQLFHNRHFFEGRLCHIIPNLREYIHQISKVMFWRLGLPQLLWSQQVFVAGHSCSGVSREQWHKQPYSSPAHKTASCPFQTTHAPPLPLPTSPISDSLSVLLGGDSHDDHALGLWPGPSVGSLGAQQTQGWSTWDEML